MMAILFNRLLRKRSGKVASENLPLHRLAFIRSGQSSGAASWRTKRLPTQAAGFVNTGGLIYHRHCARRVATVGVAHPTAYRPALTPVTHPTPPKNPTRYPAPARYG